MSDLRPSSEETLRFHAKQLNALRRRKLFARPRYDLFGDALIWEDELKIADASIPLIGAVRSLIYYRTGLIIGKARGGADLWRLGHKLFPHWVGFHSSRCNPSAWLAGIYHGYASGLQRELDEWDKLCDETED